MKRLLVVGAGNVGSKVVELSRSKGWEVSGASLSGGDGLLALDVGDSDAVNALPDFDAVVHCAASGRGGEDAYRSVYLRGCRNLSNRFSSAKLIFTSSSSVYSQTDGKMVNEESETLPGRETGRILLEAERVVTDSGGVVVRLAGIYGPGRSVLLRKFLDGEAVIEEDGRRIINQIHRDDAASAVVHLLTMANFPEGEIFNVCDSAPMSQLKVYQGMAAIFGKTLPPSGPRDLNRKRGWTHKQVSNAKIVETGWCPGFPRFLDAVGADGAICATGDLQSSDAY
ncbi:NAD-dependent epimerase/dehydratase family protein [Luteolibacter sp. AS25]|uniref:NAD-dependent epimerase/dehydratase family protein n=1 Tax=Luteolibacter sp. AS25 TaxID=3135776 RepID=UPI00398B457E